MSPSVRPSVIGCLGIAVLALSGCANPRAEQAALAQNALIGISEDTLLSCAGVPDRSRSAGGRDFFTYEVDRIDSYAYPYPGFAGAGFYRRGYWGGWGWDRPLATEIRSTYCEATFILENGRVTQINYNTPTGSLGGSLSQCYDIVQNCMGYAQSTPAP